MEATGDPSTLAPEICVEVMSPTNTEEEMQEKRRLYREIGAEEVWVVGEKGRIRFYGKKRGTGLRSLRAARVAYSPPEGFPRPERPISLSPDPLTPAARGAGRGTSGGP